MGIFATRPEEPFEWAGIPSEPARPDSEAERLDATADVLGVDVGPVESIVIPIAPEPASTPAPAEDE